MDKHTDDKVSATEQVAPLESGKVSSMPMLKSEDLSRLRQLLTQYHQNCPLAVIEWDREFRVASWNREAEKVFGYSAAEAVGRLAKELIVPPAFHVHVDQIWQALLQSRGGTRSRNENVTKAGNLIMCDWCNTPLTDPQGQIVAVYSLVQSVMDNKQMEEALRDSEHRFNSFMRHLPLSAFIKDQEGKVIFTNPYLNDLFGWKDVVGKSTFDLLPAEIAQHMVEDDRRALHEELVRTTEYITDHKGGRRVFETYKFPLENRDGTKLIGGISVDITEQKNAEEERIKLERQIQQAQKLESLGVLAGGIAHDFNNLLTAILGNVSLALVDMNTAAPGRPELMEIEIAARRAADLAKQMLAYSGKGRFMLQKLDLREVVEEMLHMLQVSISKKAVMRFNFADNLPAIEADPTQVRQIIMNLVINASEAIGDRSGVIAITTGVMDCDRAYLMNTFVAEDLPEGMYSYVEVADTGCGIAKDNLIKIFDPFFTTKFTGRGLGLAAVMGIVHSHKGAIKVYSELRKGTTIKVLFPAIQQASEKLSNGNHTLDEWRSQGHILLVDDEESVRATAKKMLQYLGFNVITAADGREAMEIFKNPPAPIVCVLLDLTMPHIDGEETYREMRRVKPDVRVILTSGYSEQDVVQRFAGKRLAGFIQKPFSVSNLQQTLKNAIQASRL
jgi:PAS domain S-box-containing protein